MAQTRLRPCPDCGQTPVYHALKANRFWGKTHRRVGCRHITHRWLTGWCETKQDAAELWNRRIRTGKQTRIAHCRVVLR